MPARRLRTPVGRSGRAALALGCLLLLAGCEPAARPTDLQPPAPGPNVVLIVVDTLRADRLTQYGHTRDTSSALGRLTASATRFDECYSPAPWTAPSVASLFTGLAPERHGVDAVGDALPRETATLARGLRRAGWQTAALSFNPHISRASGFDQGFDEFLGYRGRAARAPDIRRMTAAALAWIDEVREDGSFFLYLQPMNVHGPYRVPADAASGLLGRPPRAGFEFFGPLMRQLMNHGRVERRDDVGPAMLQSLAEKYDTAVHHTAVELGAFFDDLAARGLWDDSLVVLTADHGEELFDHGGFAHRYSLHREVLRVPLFVKLPGQTAPREVAEPVSLVDLRATLDALLGLASPAGDGRSLAPLLRGPDDAVPEALRDRAIVARASNPRRFVGHSVRVGDDELIVREHSYDPGDPALQLYDLERDPDQQTDVSDRHPERVARLRALLEHVEARYRKAPLPERSYELDPSLRQALEALGYL